MKKLLLYFCLIGILGCGGDDEGSLDLNFKLRYNEEPLVFFQDIQYPDGRNMQLSKVSFYLSNLQINNGAGAEVLSQVELADLTEAHLQASTADEGLTLKFDNLDLSNAQNISFNLGLTEEQNNTLPGDYNSGEPLGMSGEHWPDWNSYIFTKLEGKLDFDQNGSYDSGENIVLHLGTSAITRNLNFELGDDPSRLDFVIDISKVFESAEHGIYNIDENKSLHQLSEKNIELMEVLTFNLGKAMTLQQN